MPNVSDIPKWWFESDEFQERNALRLDVKYKLGEQHDAIKAQFSDLTPKQELRIAEFVASLHKEQLQLNKPEERTTIANAIDEWRGDVQYSLKQQIEGPRFKVG